MLTASLVLITTVAVQTPPDTLRYQVVNHGRHAGTMDVVTVADTIVVHVRSWDRVREANVTTRYVTDETGRIVRLEVSTAVRPNPVERFVLADGTARWRTPVGSGTADVDGPTFYWPRVYTVYNAARLAAFLLDQPQQTADLPPFQAPANAHVAIDTVVAADGRSERVRLVVMEVPALAPYLVWLDARDELFASDAAWLTTVRSGFDSVLPALRSLERRVLAERSEAVARRLTTSRTGPLVIRNGNLFDSETTTNRKGMTVVVEGERITAVGADSSVPIPAGATMLAGFIDGPGRGAGPTDAIVSTEDEAIEWVARYDSLGYRQIKVYNLVHPVVVATIVEEAKRRGMRVSGHVPRRLSVTDVVRLEFDEIQHVSFLRRLFLPDSLRAQLQQGERLTPAERMASLSAMDIDGPEATRLIELLRDHGTVIDGTLNLHEDRGTALADGTDPLFGPTLDWLPPIARRGYTVAPTPAPPARRLLQAKYHRFLKRLYDAGVTIVPGTDNTAFAYVGELEIYERAGIPAPEVLRIATLVPAQVMDEEADYGSIEPGKVADIIIVDGNPALRIADLRRIETVVRAGRVYSVRDLYAEVGVTPRW